MEQQFAKDFVVFVQQKKTQKHSYCIWPANFSSPNTSSGVNFKQIID